MTFSPRLRPAFHACTPTSYGRTSCTRRPCTPRYLQRHKGESTQLFVLGKNSLFFMPSLRFQKRCKELQACKLGLSWSRCFLPSSTSARRPSPLVLSFLWVWRGEQLAWPPKWPPRHIFPSGQRGSMVSCWCTAMWPLMLALCPCCRKQTRPRLPKLIPYAFSTKYAKHRAGAWNCFAEESSFPQNTLGPFHVIV